MNTILWIYCLT